MDMSVFFNGRYLGCFHFWAVMNKATVKTFVYRFLHDYKFSLICGKQPGVQLLGHMLVTCFVALPNHCLILKGYI